MTRYARIHAPGSLVHVISRTVNHEPRFDSPEARGAFLAFIDHALSRSDWRLIAYATMSTHFHLAMLAGERPPASFLRSLLTTTAMWLNQSHSRLGPVFAERSKTIIVPQGRAPQLIAYIHNNPVRAKIVTDASESDWTSHGPIVSSAPAPRALDRDATLALAGFTSTPRGRRGFDNMVRARRDDARDPVLSGETLDAFRADLRRSTTLPVELATPTAHDEPSRATSPLVYAGERTLEPRWSGALDVLIARVCHTRKISVDELRSRGRSRRIVDARRLALTVGARLLRRNQCEVAAALGIATSTASMLLRKAERVLPEAAALAEELRAAHSDR